jgi:hypothetical protein
VGIAAGVVSLNEYIANAPGDSMHHSENRHAKGRANVPAQLIDFARSQGNAALQRQDEFLGEFEEASRTWLARVKQEIELWSGLATKLASSTTIPEGFDACRDCFAQRLEMTVEDARTVFDEYQKAASTMARPFSHAAERHKTAHNKNKQEHKKGNEPWNTPQKSTA